MNVLLQRIHLLAVGLLLITPALAERAAAPQMPGSPLTVDAVEGIAQITRDHGRFDFGEVDPFAAPVLKKRFRVTNRSGAPVRIARVQPSCGCSEVKLLTPGPPRPASAAYVLPPGASVHVEVMLDLSHLKPGLQEKYAWVYLENNPLPAATLEMAGVTRQLIAFRPDTIDFGIARAGRHREINVTVEMDARLAPGGRWPELISTNSDVRIQPQPLEPAETPIVTRSYVVSVARKARFGYLRGVLEFVKPRGAKPPAGALPQPLFGVTAPLMGTIQASISTQPQSVVFGGVEQGKEAEAELLVEAQEESALTGLRVETGTPNLIARLGPVERVQTPQGALYRVRATLACGREMPAGGRQIIIAVVTRANERLEVPVIVYVTPGRAGKMGA